MMRTTVKHTMNTIEEFKEDMKLYTLEFSCQQLNDIYNSVNDEEYNSIDNLLHDVDTEEYTVLVDANLSSLIDNLNELETDYIMNVLYSLYGSMINLYWLNDDRMYAMIYGNR